MICEKCEGSGKEKVQGHPDQPLYCETCGGTGTVNEHRREAVDAEFPLMPEPMRMAMRKAAPADWSGDILDECLQRALAVDPLRRRGRRRKVVMTYTEDDLDAARREGFALGAEAMLEAAAEVARRRATQHQEGSVREIDALVIEKSIRALRLPEGAAPAVSAEVREPLIDEIAKAATNAHPSLMGWDYLDGHMRRSVRQAVRHVLARLDTVTNGETT